MASSSSDTSSLYHSMDGASADIVPQPASQRPRRKPSPALPRDSLNPPSPDIMAQKRGRPPSPLRNGHVPNTFTGIDGDGVDDDDDDEDDNDPTWRSPSPTSSVSQFAANIAQRVGSFVGSISPRSGLPTQAELEAEAERERDRSRMEAERILTQEAEERRLVEEKVLAMMQSNRSGSPKSLPPTPGRSQTLPNTPSPSQKESGPSWWIAAKNRLTPTKEPLTPAQQIIQETKAREKDKKNNKGKEKEWPASTQGKYQDPAYLNLTIPVAPPQRRPVPSSPSSPTPSRPGQSNAVPPPLTPSPMRSSNTSSSSPSNEPPMLYAQFNAQGTLDIPGTLLIIAKRFEKLEKWTVGHVRALEERMSDVEKWLVDKEKEKEAAPKRDAQHDANQAKVLNDVHEIRDEVSELQGQVGELGRELAKLATAPANLSSVPSSQSAQVLDSPQTATSYIARPLPEPVPQTPRLGSTTARESTSPPMASSRGSRTRLPYPSGDYANSSDTAVSPSASSPSSVHSTTRPISGLPPASLGTYQPPSTSLPTSTSPVASVSPPFAKPSSRRPQNISPTPRKRYTVALGGPITAPSESSKGERRSRSPIPLYRPPLASDDESDDDKDVFQDETIGKSAAAKLAQASKAHENANRKNATISSSSSPQSSPPAPRIRAQSVYGMSSLYSQSLAAPAPLARMRPRSTDRLGLGIFENDTGGLLSPTSNKFIDPLVLRRQEKEKEAGKIAMPIPARGKVPVGQLVAFFDGDKRERD